jgi:hypothetical protein
LAGTLTDAGRVTPRSLVAEEEVEDVLNFVEILDE